MKDFFYFIKTNKLFSISVFLIILIILIAIFAPFISPYDPYESVLKDALLKPDSNHICGTDKLGRDLFSRIIFGTRISLTSACGLVFIILFSGTILGIISGYFGGIIDSIIMRISDMMISFPGMILAIAVAGILGANTINAIIAISIVSWTKYARLSRSLVLKIKNQDYILSAKVNGTRTINILLHHIIPNIIPTLIITASTDIGTMMLELAGLSFLGFGAQAPTAEWGLMLNEGRAFIRQAPWLLMYPGIAIAITVTLFNIAGDCIHDIMNPHKNKLYH